METAALTLTETQRKAAADLVRLCTPRTNRYIKQSPLLPPPGEEPNIPQAAFLVVPWRECLYGGAAGGGKSSALLMAALQYVDVPGYAALILRRTYTELSKADALIPRSHEWLAGTDAKWSGDRKCWTFSSGATLEFGHVEHEQDKFAYQSAAWQYIGFDELTQFTRTQYLYLLSRLRRLAGVGVPIRARSASNPGGEGHEWVRERFIPEWYVEHAEPGEPKWSEPDESGDVEPVVFIPAKLEDNFGLDRVEYAKTLSVLDPVSRFQLRHGDWSVRPAGSLFRRESFEIVEAVPAGQSFRYWDFAATAPTPIKGGGTKDPDWTRGVRGRFVDGVLYVEDVRSLRDRPAAVEALVKQTAQVDGRSVGVWIEQEPGASGVNTIDGYQRRVLSGFAVRGHRVTGPQMERVRPLSAAADAGNVKLLRGAWNKDFLDEIEAYPQVGMHDDQVTATAGLLEVLTVASTVSGIRQVDW